MVGLPRRWIALGGIGCAWFSLRRHVRLPLLLYGNQIKIKSYMQSSAMQSNAPSIANTANPKGGAARKKSE